MMNCDTAWRTPSPARKVINLAKSATGEDAFNYRSEFIKQVETARMLDERQR